MGAVSMTKIIEKAAHFHNGKLRFFWVKNTISCGSFNLPTKPIVQRQNQTPPVL